MKRGARLFSAFGLAQIVTLLAIGTALWLAFVPWRWGRLREELRGRFPKVPFITPEEFADWRAKPVEQAVLFDARGEEEYNTSHIPGARRAPQNPALLGVDAKSGIPIVVYCSVGIDSAPVALRYRAQGYERVQYLDGGIFLWAHEGRPLENLRGPAHKVHPGNGAHISYLDRKFRPQ